MDRNPLRFSSPHTGKYEGCGLPLNCVLPGVNGVGAFVNVGLKESLKVIDEGNSLRVMDEGKSLRIMMKSGEYSSVWWRRVQ